jgi:hypothetical protein
MRLDRAVARLLTALVLLFPSAALATPVVFSPGIEQCDGTFTGTATRRNAPRVRTSMQDSTGGLKIGQRTATFYTGTRIAANFEDSQYQVLASSCVFDAAAGTAFKSYTWNYQDFENTQPDQGLLATYYDQLNFGALFTVQIDANVNFTLGSGAAPVAGMGADQWSARWTGAIYPASTQTDWQICAAGSDDWRLYLGLGGALREIADQPAQDSAGEVCSQTLSLTGGRPYEIALEYNNNTGGKSMSLRWRTTNGGIGAGTVVPSSALRPLPVMRVGQCHYSGGTSCSAGTMALVGGSSWSPPHASAFAAGTTCPASTSTAGGAASIVAGTYAMPSDGTQPFAGSPQAFTLDGTNHNFRIGIGAHSYMPPSYAISAWAKTNNAWAGTQRIISQQIGGRYWLFRVIGGELEVEDSRDGAGPGDLNATIPNDGNWHFLAAVRRNGISWTYFVDGRKFTTTSVSSSTHVIGTTTADDAVVADGTWIGSIQGGGEKFNGLLDDIRIYPGSISDDTMMMEYAANAYRYSADSGATFGVSTTAYVGGAPAHGTTAIVTQEYSTGVVSTARFVFAAQSADGLTTSVAGLTPNIDASAPAAPTLTATPLAGQMIQWNFASTKFCDANTGTNFRVHLHDAASAAEIIQGVALPPAAGSLVGIEDLTSDPTPNMAHARAGKINDAQISAFGSAVASSLGLATTAYTLPNAPSALTATVVISTAITLQWNTNSNPAYTRYELSMSQDNFATGIAISTPITVAQNFTGNSFQVGGLNPGEAYFFRVRAVSGQSSDSFGGAFTNFANLSTFTTPDAVTVTPIAVSNTQIDWSFPKAQGADQYNVFNGLLQALPCSPVVTPGAAGTVFTCSQNGLQTNTLYSVVIQPVNAGGNGPLTSATSAYTLAAAPAAMTVTGVSTNTASFQWDAGGGLNPGHTFYSVNVATDSAFAVVVATKTTQALTMTVNGLFPGSTYYARVRAVSGGQRFTAPTVAGATVTNRSSLISLSSAPPSAYVPPSGTIGLWQFDEGSGLTLDDSSDFDNDGQMTCVAPFCSSTGWPRRRR